MKRNRKTWVIDTLLLMFVSSVLLMYIVLNMPQATVHIVKTGLDDLIPRLPVFAVPYLAFLPWLWGTLIYSWIKNHSFRQLAVSLIVINLIAFVVYLTFQTYVPRALISSHDFFSNLLQFIYDNDRPYNGLPSLHSAMSASIATYFVCRKSKWSWVAVLMAVLVVLSTLLVKQHFILDALSGVVLGIIITLFVFRLNKKR